MTWLNSQAATWYVPQLVHSVSVLLLKNILGWRNVLYFMAAHIIKLFFFIFSQDFFKKYK